MEGGGNPGVHGAWRLPVGPIRPGATYRLVARYRAEGVRSERRSISARFDWLDESGKRAHPPDVAGDRLAENGWVHVEITAPAPENARRVAIELTLSWAPHGTVWWDGIELLEIPPPGGRLVRVMAVRHRPRDTAGPEESVESFCRLVESASMQRPDIVCLPEGVTLVGTGRSYAAVAESLPGRTTDRLGALARRLRAYVVAGLYERVGALVYNTAVLLDREGRLAGTYRKTHLPYEEVEGGITPGDSYPVFKTDFGTVGLLICWDVQFPEPARAMSARGAELLLLPIWGGSEVLARARAQENHVYLATSSYDMKTFIVGPEGKVLAEAGDDPTVALAEIDLDLRIVQPWLGDMKNRTWKERRPDLPVP
jgi:predicted amidohydrolase